MCSVERGSYTGPAKLRRVKIYTKTGDDGTTGLFGGSRVRKDDLLTIQVDGTDGSAVIGLRKCLVQPHSLTPKAIWNPDIDSPIDYFDGWHEVPDAANYDNAFKIQWEKFIRHVELDEPFRWSLLEGAKGVQLAEVSLDSHDEKCWKDVPELG